MLPVVRTTSSTGSDASTTINTAYSIAVRTSAVVDAETRAYVFVKLFDVNGRSTDRVKLKCSITHRQKYRRGHSDLFLLIDQPELGQLRSIEVTHMKKYSVGEEGHKAWHLHSILVIHHDRNELYRFEHHKWLGDKEDQEDTIELMTIGEPHAVMPADADQLFG